MNHAFIYGRNPLKRIVSIEPHEQSADIYIESESGVRCQVVDYARWLVASEPLPGFTALSGSLHYRYYAEFKDRGEWLNCLRRHKNKVWRPWDDKEAAMLLSGLTYYKGMKVSDVSVLSFDIEATGLEHDSTAKVLLIPCTFRRNGFIERKLFAYDQYPNEAAMFDDMSAWVRKKNPSIVMGHNVYGYDLPYMDYCARRAGTSLKWGRDGSSIRFEEYESKFRKDGSQFYTYHKAHIYGRELVDTMFLAIKADAATRKYENYRLKDIIKHEGLEVAGRQFYDAAQIGANYKDPIEWPKIKKYAEHDADDALTLFDLMAPAYFYLTQSVPKPFQSMINSASGAQINSFLVRSYLQVGHSLPKESPPADYEGAISFGNPGIYQNVFKVDVASLYPSIMLQEKIYDRMKDPQGHFLAMVEHFTEERLANKKRAKETGERYYKDIEQAQKIIINSAYGMLGSTGLLFNSPQNARAVTTKGREILQTAIEFSTKGCNLTIVNADTDSVSVAPLAQNAHLPWSTEDREHFLQCLNNLMPARIRWEDDGVYPRMVVIKAKNYVLDDGKSIKIKGSALKATNKEKALKEFISRSVELLLDGNKTGVEQLYYDYVKEILNVQDIARWTSKKTVTAAVMNPGRTNEAKVNDALDGSDYRMGDKIYTYFDTSKAVKLQEHWKGDHDIESLLKKLYKTVVVFETILDLTRFPNFKLKRNKTLLSSLFNKTA